MVNKYQFKVDGASPFLVYGEGKVPHEDLGLELLEENINLIEDIESQIYPIYRVQDLMIRAIPLSKKPRVRDKVLEEEGIISFYDLQNAYNLLRARRLNKSARVRAFVEEKYSEIINIDYAPTTDRPTSIDKTNVGDNSSRTD